MRYFKNIFDNRRVFVQVYILIIVFTTIPLLFGGALYYSNANQKLENEFVKNNKNLLLQAVTAIDMVIDTVFETTKQIYGDTYIMNIITKSRTVDQLEKDRIINRLSQIRDSSKFIHSVTLMLDDEREIYDTNYGYCLLKDFPDKELFYIYDSTDRQTVFIDHRKSYRSKFLSESSQNVMTLLIKLPFGKLDYNGALVVNINSDKVYESIIKKLKFNDERELVIINKDGSIILNNNNTNILPKLMDYGELCRFVKSDKESVIKMKDNERYLVTYLSSSYLNWDFIWVNSYKEVYKTISSVRNVIVVSSIILQAFLLLLGIFIIQRTVKPMDEVLNNFVGKEAISGKRVNAFRDISEYVRRIIANNQQLREALDKAIPVFKERFLYSLLTSGNINQEDALKRLTEFNIKFKYKSFYVLTFEILNLYELVQKNIEVNLVKFGIDELLKLTLEANGLTGYIVNINDEKISVIINMSDDQAAKAKMNISHFAGQFCADVLEKMNIELIIGVSSKCEDIDELNILYNDSLEALKYRTITDTDQVVFIDEVRSDEVVLGKYPLEAEEKLDNYIVLGEEEKAVGALKEMLQKFKSEASLSGKVFHSFVLQLFATLSKVAARLNVDVYESMTKNGNLFNTLVEIKTLKAAEMFFSQMVVIICNETKKNRKDVEKQYLDRILSYIDEHYCEDVSMDVLSQEANISASYIYKIMKDNLNKTFVEYLTEKRLEKACELLGQNFKVQDIAEQIGFSSAKYFIKVFKQYKGCTPNKYRQICSW